MGTWASSFREDRDFTTKLFFVLGFLKKEALPALFCKKKKKRKPNTQRTTAVLKSNFWKNLMDYVANPVECLSCFFSEVEYLFC